MTFDEKVERVARTLVAYHGMDPDDVVECNGSQMKIWKKFAGEAQYIIVELVDLFDHKPEDFA